LAQCQFTTTYWDYESNKEVPFKCLEEPLELGLFCFFHDKTYLEDRLPNLREEHAKKVIDGLTHKVNESITDKKALHCIGYHLPDTSIQGIFNKPLYFSAEYLVNIIPNASDVHAIVKDKRVQEKDNTAYIKLHVIRADNYKSMPNFMKDNIGKVITIVVSKDDLDFFKKDQVNLLVSVSGDERHQFYTARIKPK